MERHVVIGTAGHVDHGKTALVKAVTGIDTDRWEEERRRGITIDLGFANLELADGIVASIVDVPGHEDFVRNMVAGATGVDVALLVVAADEGIMPQTTEHLDILEFLGIRTGVVAITKSDLVEHDWLELVRGDVTERLSSSRITWDAVLPVSAETGDGLEDLVSSLARAAVAAPGRDADDLFRLPVDRVFSVAGAGTVVTGTTWSGTVRPGDEVWVLPRSDRARVRSVEVHGKVRDTAQPGRRTALALSGLDRRAVERGSVVVNSSDWRATNAIDAEVTLLRESPRLTQRSRVRLHLGTAEVMARVTPAEQQINPGSTGVARLRVESPVVARWGDRGVLRRYSPVTTIGGFTVIDPWPPARPRRPAVDPERRDAKPDRRLAALVTAAGTRGIKRNSISVRLGIKPSEVKEVLADSESVGVCAVGDLLLPEEVLHRARKAALLALEEFHESNPVQVGKPLEVLRRLIGGGPAADQVLSELRKSGKITVESGAARLATHLPVLKGKDAEAAERLIEALAAAGPKGVTADELARKLPGCDARAIAEYYVRRGTAARVGSDRYYERETLQSLIRTALDAIGRLGQATPTELRERLGLSRKYLIPFLEWLDSEGLTVRVGDARKLRQGTGEYPPSPLDKG